jgi:hypothetical protein
LAAKFDKFAWFEKTGYQPHDAQLIVHRSTARFRVLAIGRRWGKTLLGAKEAEPCAFVISRITGGPQIGWIVGPQYTDSEKEFRVVYDSFRRLGIDKHCLKFVNNVESGNMHLKTDWGFDLQAKSAGHPESLVAEGLDFVLMVEAGRHKRKTWGEYIRPTLSDRRGWALFSGVPEGRSQHSLLYSLMMKGRLENKPSWQSWQLPSWTNTVTFPGGRQDPEIVDAADDLTQAEFDRQYGAQFAEKVGRVMQDWSDEIHLRQLEYNPSWPLYAGIDYGFTNPFVWLWIQVDPWKNVYVIRERRWTLVDTEDVCRDLLSNPIDRALVKQCVAFYPDPAEPDRTRTVQNLLKIPARGNTGGPLLTRLSMIWKLLKIPSMLEYLPDGHPEKVSQIFFDQQLTADLCWEMREGYRWPEHRSEVRSTSEHPINKDDHGPEALGRFVRGFFGDELLKTNESRIRNAKVRR